MTKARNVKEIIERYSRAVSDNEKSYWKRRLEWECLDESEQTYRLQDFTTNYLNKLREVQE